MSLTNGLEKLYNERMQKDEALKMEYEDLLKHVVDKVITKMKDQSPEFQAIYSETHYRKAFFDELKENSSQQELDLNIVLFHGDLELLGDLCMLMYRFQGYLMGLFDFVKGKDGKGETFICPNKIFEVLQKSVGQALTSQGLELMCEGRTYRVTHEVPATLVIAASNGSKSCKVNLVPTFRINGNRISTIHQKITGGHGRVERNTIMAKALPGAGKLMIDLSEVELCTAQSALWSEVKMLKWVIKLMEHLRNVKGGSWLKLSTQLLKVGLPDDQTH